MAEYRAGLIVDIGAREIADSEIGALLDLLRAHDGSISVEEDRMVVTFSFDASDLPGVASGLVAAMPRVVGISTMLLRKSGLADRTTVLGLSVERPRQ